jgi:hypothetical protein
LKSLLSFILGATVVYLFTFSVERKTQPVRNKRTVPPIRVDLTDTIDPDDVVREILGSSIRTLHQFGQDYLALMQQPRTLKGVFANHGR